MPLCATSFFIGMLPLPQLPSAYSNNLGFPDAFSCASWGSGHHCGPERDAIFRPAGLIPVNFQNASVGF